MLLKKLRLKIVRLKKTVRLRQNDRMLFILLIVDLVLTLPLPLPPITNTYDLDDFDDEPFQPYELITSIGYERGGFFEGDINLEGNLEDDANSKEPKKWKNATVFYIIGTEFDDVETSLVKDAMSEIEKTSCIKFVERRMHDYVLIRKLYGCHSFLGFQGGEQILSIGESCFSKGVIIHELLHVLGFWHEQSRLDRDDYVTVKWENIYPKKEKNFKKYSMNVFNEKYDYGSIMHYGTHAFSRDGISPTIIPKEKNVYIGQRTKLSKIDISKINKLYCQKELPTPPPPPPITKELNHCRDILTLCPFWAIHGYCVTKRRYMVFYCRKSCGICKDKSINCKDYDPKCVNHLEKGYCRTYPEYTYTMCKHSCNYC